MREDFDVSNISIPKADLAPKKKMISDYSTVTEQGSEQVTCESTPKTWACIFWEACSVVTVDLINWNLNMLNISFSFWKCGSRFHTSVSTVIIIDKYHMNLL